MFLAILKWILILAFAYLLFAIAKAQIRTWKYQRQGVVFMPYSVLLDNFRVAYAAYINPDRMAVGVALERYYGTKQYPKITGLNMFGLTAVTFNHPDCLQELYLTKNQTYSKHEIEAEAGAPLVISNIVNLKTEDPQYKPKRKALSQAFFKNKVVKMQTLIKRTLLKAFKEIQEKGPETEVDLMKFTSKVQGHIIVDMLLGGTHSFDMLQFVKYDGTVEPLCVAMAMDKIIDLVFDRFKDNPLMMFAPGYFATKQITKSDVAAFKNSAMIRNYILGHIHRKKAEIQKGVPQDEEELDMLSIIVNDENYQNEEDIIDDFLVMFIAGAKTVQITTTNFIMMMKHRPDIKAKFEAEYQPLMEQVKDDIMKKMTPDLIENLEYTKMTYQEILRRYSPIPTSSTNTVSKTTTYNGVTFHKGDAFYVNLENIHKRDDEWKDCLKFIPERFDPHSEYYLRPDGKKRNPLSFNPFLGGQRICLGKTFAEITLKYSLPLYHHFFDFELLDAKQKAEMLEFELGGMTQPTIPVKMITKNKVVI